MESPAQAPRARRRRESRLQRREQARARLLSSAFELAERASFRDLTVEEIAATAGLSRTAFYLHFPGKPELLIAALDEVAEGLSEAAAAAAGEETSPARRMRAIVARLVAAYAENATVLRVATEVAAYDAQVHARWRAVISGFLEPTAARIAAEQRDGLIRAGIDARATAEALVWMAERCCYVGLALERRDPEAVVTQIATVWSATLYPGVIPASELAAGGERTTLHSVPSGSDENPPEGSPDAAA